MQEHVQCLHALLEASLELGPFMRRKDARHDIKGDGALSAVRIAINRKRNADPTENEFGFFATCFKGVFGLLRKPLCKASVMRAWTVTVRLIFQCRDAAVDHLVKGNILHGLCLLHQITHYIH